MMIVVVHPQSLSKVLEKKRLKQVVSHQLSFVFFLSTQVEIDQMKKDLLNYFVTGPGGECDLKSIYFQSW